MLDWVLVWVMAESHGIKPKSLSNGINLGVNVVACSHTGLSGGFTSTFSICFPCSLCFIADSLTDSVGDDGVNESLFGAALFWFEFMLITFKLSNDMSGGILVAMSGMGAGPSGLFIVGVRELAN